MTIFRTFQAGLRISPDAQFTADPVTGKVGEIYYNTTRNILRICTDATPIWQDLYILPAGSDFSTLAWDVAADRWVANEDLKINGSTVFTVDAPIPLELFISAGSSTTAGTGIGGNIVLSTGAGDGGDGVVLIDSALIKGEIDLSTPLTVSAGNTTDAFGVGNDLILEAGVNNNGGTQGNVYLQGNSVDINTASMFTVTSDITSIDATMAIDLTAPIIGIKAQSATDPVTGERGDFYYNTTYDRFRVHDGTSWSFWDTTANNTSIALADYRDNTLTTLPTDTSTPVDGATIVDGDWALFTNLGTGNNQIYIAAVSGTAITWTAAVFGQDGTGLPVDGDITYIKAGATSADRLYSYTGTEWVAVGIANGLNVGNTLVWDGASWVYNDSVNISDNNIFIRDGLASGDLTITTGTDVGATDGNLTLNAKTGLVNLIGERINIGAQSAGDPATGAIADIFYNTNRNKLGYHDHVGYRDVDGGDVTGEYTGFPSRDDSNISFDEGTRTFTIAPDGSSYDYYIQGQRYRQSTSQAIILDDLEIDHYIVFDGLSLQVQTGFDSILHSGFAYVAHIYWNQTDQKAVIFEDKRHGLVMDADTILFIKNNLGLQTNSGYDISSFTTTGDGSVDAHGQLSIAAGSSTDKDITYNTASFSDLPVVYKLGSTVTWTKDTATTTPVRFETSIPQYSFDNAGTWETADVTDGNYFAMWVFNTGSLTEPIVSIMGESQYTSLYEAQSSETYANLTLDGLPTSEIKALYRLVFEYNTAFTNTTKVALRDVLDVRAFNDQDIDTHGAFTLASDILIDTSNFGGDILTPTETNMQLALDRIDDIALRNDLANVPKLAADPVGTTNPEVYYNTIDNVFRYYDGTEWKDLGSGGGYVWTTQTANYTASDNDGILADTITTGAFTLTLPDNPAQGEKVKIADGALAGGFSTNNLTVASGAGGATIRNNPSPFIMDVDYGWVEMVYEAASNDWRLLGPTVTRSGALELVTITSGDSPFSADIFTEIYADATAGVITINLPAGSAGDKIAIVDYGETWFSLNNVSVTPNGSENINGSNTPLILDVDGGWVELTYIDAIQGWRTKNG